MASLTGYAGIAPRIGGVIISEDNYNFAPGSVVQINSNALPGGENDFLPFNGLEGVINNLDLANPVGELIEIPGAFTFFLESVDTPVFIETAFGTTNQFSGTGQFISETGDVTEGLINFSADYVGFSQEQAIDLTSASNNFVASWSLNTVAFEPIGETIDIDEPSMAYGLLLLVALLFGFTRSRSRKPNN